MKIYYSFKFFWTFIITIFISLTISQAQPNSSVNLSTKAKVEKETEKNYFVLTFDSVIIQFQTDFSKFEEKVTQANFNGFKSFEINPNSNKVTTTTTFRIDISEENLEKFL